MKAKQRRRRRSPGTAFFLVGAFVAAAAAVPSVLALGWHWLPAYLAGVNLATLVLYGYDKLVAGRRRVRVPEATLHAFAFAGGTPAALVARHLFRHKTLKRSFRVVFWLLIVLQAAMVAGVLWLERSW